MRNHMPMTGVREGAPEIRGRAWNKSIDSPRVSRVFQDFLCMSARTGTRCHWQQCVLQHSEWLAGVLKPRLPGLYLSEPDALNPFRATADMRERVAEVCKKLLHHDKDGRPRVRCREKGFTSLWYVRYFTKLWVYYHKIMSGILKIYEWNIKHLCVEYHKIISQKYEWIHTRIVTKLWLDYYKINSGLSQNYEWIITKLWADYHIIMIGLSQNYALNRDTKSWVV